MTKSTDREIFHYTAGTLYPGGMPPTEISLLMTVAKLIACKPDSPLRNRAFDYIQAAVECLRREEEVTK